MSPRTRKQRGRHKHLYTLNVKTADLEKDFLYNTMASGETGKTLDEDQKSANAQRSSLWRPETEVGDTFKKRKCEIKFFLYDAFMHLLFLGLLIYVALESFSPWLYYLHNGLEEVFVRTEFRGFTHAADERATFESVKTIDEFWEYLETPLIHGLYWSDLTAEPAESNASSILGDNMLISKPRLRQFRVSLDHCTVPDKYQKFVRACYPVFKTAFMNTSLWKEMSKNNSDLQSSFKYHSPEQVDSPVFYGEFAWYPGGGSVTYLPLRTEANASAVATNIIQRLKAERWVTQATRAVLVDFTVYNLNINLFAVIRLVFEFPATGAVWTSRHIQAVRFLRYASTYSYYLSIFELAWGALVAVLALRQMVALCVFGCKGYFKQKWNWVDLLLIALSVAVSFMYVRRYLVVESHIHDLVHKSLKGEPQPFDRFAIIQQETDAWLALLLFVAMIKVFRFLSFNATMTQLSTTLSRCFTDIFSFSSMFIIAFMAFVVAGHLLFGHNTPGFQTVGSTVLSLLRIIFGDLDLETLIYMNPYLGPSFFIFYVFFVFFCLLNMFLAIVNDTYSEVKSEMKAQGYKFEVADYVRDLFSRCCCCCRSKNGREGKKEYNGLREAQLAAEDGAITTSEIRQHLIRVGFSPLEVETFLTKYHLEDNRALDEDEIEIALSRLEKENAWLSEPSSKEPNEAMGDFATGKYGTNELVLEQIHGLDARVLKVEMSLSNMVQDVDRMVTRLERLVR